MRAIKIVILCMLPALLAAQNWNNLDLNQVVNLVNGNPAIPVGGVGIGAQMLCLPQNCLSVDWGSPTLFAQDFYQQKSEEENLLAQWWTGFNPNNLPAPVRDAFYWFLNTAFQSPGMFAPTTNSLQFRYIVPKPPGAPPVVAFPIEKTFTLQN